MTECSRVGAGAGAGVAGRSVEHIISSISNTQSNALRARDTAHHKSRQKTHQQWIFARKALRAHLTQRAKKFKNKDSERRCKRMPCVHGV